MAKKKLNTTDRELCYKRALKGLAPQDRININCHIEDLGKHLEKDVGKKSISKFIRLEILAQLGVWLNKEHPID